MRTSTLSRLPKRAALAGAVASAAVLAAGAIFGQTTSDRVDYARSVQPLLKAHCYQCHGADQQMGGLRLDQQAAALKGGISGKAIVPGKSAESLLIARVEGAGGKPRMPFGFAPLSAPDIALLRKWIDQGAPWAAGPAKPHWAYVKPVRPVLPRVKNPAWVRNPIDAFVLARLERAGLQPSPPAPRETLIRRVTLDLIGLPPTPEEVDAFLRDRRPDAYERVVDGLLASPRYGERWARPWLDLARYADSNGYEKDLRRSMWPYRDWVINALNMDMPFDEFTIEQIAGDLLPGATQDQRVASGFHRNTMLNEEGGVDVEEQRWLTNVDRVSTTGQVWLGTTIGCAQCHNHKYDPFTQKDYYRLLAFWEHTTEPMLEVIPDEQRAKRKVLEDEIAKQDAALKAAGADKAALAPIDARLAELKKEIDATRGPTTLVMQETADHELPATYVRIKGSFLNRSDRVTAGTPAVLPPIPAGKPLNRLGLAYWLVDPANPLTARVTVNRAWEQLFGRGIVETCEDFGTQGQRPTHPELLDWLAVEFMHPTRAPAKPWSVKALHRLIVTSATYRQSSRFTPLLQQKDPYNKLLARGPRFRLEAEMVRDSALAIGGLLSRKIGGPSVFPLQPDGIWDVPYSGEQWTTSTGEDLHRRGLYTFWRRSAPYPSFLTFDATSREFCTVRRIRTNTPLQALTVLNDPAFMEAARALADTMRKGAADPARAIAAGFRRCVARGPRPTELAALTALYRKSAARYGAAPTDAAKLVGLPRPAPDAPDRAAWTVVANVLLNMDETLTIE